MEEKDTTISNITYYITAPTITIALLYYYDQDTRTLTNHLL